VDLTLVKTEAARVVDELAPKLKATSRRLFDRPELGYQEVEAADLLVGLLAEGGYVVRRGLAGLATAFQATWPPDERPNEPVIALLAEYDALPGVGHGCGHNIIAAAAVGAGLALARVSKKARARGEAAPGIPGRVTIIGSPAEEGGVEGAGGKVVLVEAGVFGGVDAALMVHPGVADAPSGRSSCRLALEVSFRGRTAHAAGSAHEGVNALEAVLQTFNGINALRQHMPGSVRIHGVVVKGGEVPNVVPDEGQIRLYVRAPSRSELEPAAERVRDCARGAALATGCRVDFREYAHTYIDFLANGPLDAAFGRNMAELGRPLVKPAEAARGLGSTDMGNVSHVVPALHAYIAIGEKAGGPVPHSREFALASVSPQGEAALIVAAKALAMTCLDLLLSPEVLRAVEEAGPKMVKRRFVV
jgi:amidohydrolase